MLKEDRAVVYCLQDRYSAIDLVKMTILSGLLSTFGNICLHVKVIDHKHILILFNNNYIDIKEIDIYR